MIQSWNILQALAWLQFKDEARVARYGGLNPRRAAAADAIYLDLDEAAARDRRRLASQTLLEALRAGHVQAFRSNEVVPPHAWLSWELDGVDAAACRLLDQQVRDLADGKFDRPPTSRDSKPRRYGGRNYVEDDKALAVEMQTLIQGGVASSPYNAALKLVPRAKGHPHTRAESIAKRLVRVYQEVVSAQDRTELS